MIEAPDTGTGGALVGVDVGGTFTDAVVIIGDRLITAKRPTTPEDQSEAAVAAVQAALAGAGLRVRDVAVLAHGTTTGTNALLEGRGAPTALVATEGFGDLLELRRQTRAALYDLAAHHPAPLVAPDRIVEAAERTGPEGVLRPLTSDAVDAVVEAVRRLDVSAVAVGLLFSFAHPGHERQIAAALRAALPHTHVSASHEVLPEIREYERISTTVVDAYLTPVLRRYLDRLGARAHAAGLPSPSIMQGTGGVLPIEAAAEHAAWTVLSGPAGGVIGAAAFARAEGVQRALTFDMGGTSCDVALIEDGEPARTAATLIAGHPVHLPQLDIVTVSAGGGSIAWADSGGALRVGPRSAGARPGPAAYGHGGDEPTVTDANVALGRLDPDVVLGDAIRLDPDRARAAVNRLGSELGLGEEACASGIVAVANQEMIRALRRVSVERGIDPRGCTLIAFGGAGPLHAAEIADELGIDRVLCPPAAGLLAALGLVVAGERRDYVQTVLKEVHDRSRLQDDLGLMAAQAEREMPGGGLEASADCRYRGQTHTLTIPWSADRPASELRETFHAAHRTRYGDCDPSRTVEAVSLRLASSRPGREPVLAGRREGSPTPGPAVLPMRGATCWIAAGWEGERDSLGAVRLEHAR